MLELHFPCQSNLAFALISVHFWLVRQEVKLQSKAWWPHRCCLYLSRRLITSAGAQRLLVERGNHIAYPPDIASTLSQWHWTLLPSAFSIIEARLQQWGEKKGLLENSKQNLYSNDVICNPVVLLQISLQITWKDDVIVQGLTLQLREIDYISSAVLKQLLMLDNYLKIQNTQASEQITALCVSAKPPICFRFTFL